jgi:hypothetical protein
MKTIDIEKFAGRGGVKRVAVENFLSSLAGSTRAEALGNLRQDARDYRWNAPTTAAISDGIKAVFG